MSTPERSRHLPQRRLAHREAQRFQSETRYALEIDGEELDLQTAEAKIRTAVREFAEGIAPLLGPPLFVSRLTPAEPAAVVRAAIFSLREWENSLRGFQRLDILGRAVSHKIGGALPGPRPAPERGVDGNGKIATRTSRERAHPGVGSLPCRATDSSSPGATPPSRLPGLVS
jgi:hypothetical protein